MDFIDRTGDAVAYLDDDGEAIYLWDGTPVAFFSGDSIYSYSGKHLGYFTDGWIRGAGAAVVFIDDATGADAAGSPSAPSEGSPRSPLLHADRPLLLASISLIG